MTQETQSEPTVLPVPFLPHGKDELNLAEFPIALLTDRVPAGRKTIEFQDEIFDEGRGQVVSRRLTVTASDKYGLPTAKDDEVIVGLVQLTNEANNFTDHRVNFTRMDLLRLLGWEDTGQNYKRIAASLCRWAGVFLHWENSWWDKQQQAWTTRGFHVIESFEINDSRSVRGQLELPYSRIVWNEVFFRNLQSGHLKRLDLDLYRRLKHPTAKRLYRFLDKRFYHRAAWTFDLRELAHEHIGLSRGYADNGKIKEKLQPALEELEAVGFLEPMGREERYTKVGRSEWKISVSQKSCEQAKTEKPQRPDPLGLEADLTARGVTASTAAELVGAFPAEHVQGKIEVFDWLVEKKDKRVSRSPAGYLVESIRENYALPTGYVSKAERAKREESEREKRRQEAEAKQRQREERLREAREQAKIKKYWDLLGKADQEQLDHDALANANPELLKSYEAAKGGPVQSMMLRFIREARIRTLLGIPAASQAIQ